MNQEEINIAKNALKSSIQRYIHRCQKKRKNLNHHSLTNTSQEEESKQLLNEIQKTTNHACQVLQNLYLKRTSFTHAVTSFATLTKECISVLSSSKSRQKDANIPQLFQHWFTFYLRLKDGLVLLQSGEIRHLPDKIQKTSVKTKLGGDESQRGDGYTRLYSSSKGYTGLGWDEFFDEDVGIQTRLIESLGRLSGGGKKKKGSNVWERIMENCGGTPFENSLEYHEMKLQQAKDEFDVVKDSFVRQINSLLVSHQTNRGGTGGIGSGKFTLVTEDKFERMSLTNVSAVFSINRLEIERRGNDDFVVNDIGGVLPNDAKRDYWEKIMKIPSSITAGKKKEGGEKRVMHSSSASAAAVATTMVKKRKRLVIEDDSSSSSSSDDDDDTRSSKKSSSGGAGSAPLPTFSSSTSNFFTTKKQTTKKQQKIASSPKNTNTIQKDAKPVNNSSSSSRSSGSGLRVKIVENNTKSSSNSITTTKNNTSTSSLNQIKTQLGINPTTLQTSYDDVQNQEKNSLMIGNVVDADVALDSSTTAVFFKGTTTEKHEDEDEQEEEDEDEEEEKELYEEIMKYREDVGYYQGVYHRLMKKKGGDKRKRSMDMDEEWDAREDLRGSMMTLGNHLLSLYSLTNRRRQRRRKRQQHKRNKSSPPLLLQPPSHLKEAEQFFRKSVELVKEQEESHRASMVLLKNVNNNRGGEEEEEEESKTIQRTLLLLRGRALTNVGIALFHQASFLLDSMEDETIGNIFISSPSKQGRFFPNKDKDHNNSKTKNEAQSLLRQSISFVKSAEECARAMKGRAVAASSSYNHNNTNKKAVYQKEAQMDIIFANQLETLALRWHGKALWLLGNKRKEAVDVLEKASGAKKQCLTADDGVDDTLQNGDNEEEEEEEFCDATDTQMVDSKIQLLVEKYYAAIDLVDVTIDTVESPSFAHQQRQIEAMKTKKSPDKYTHNNNIDDDDDDEKNNENSGEYIVSLSHRGYQQAAKISASISRMTDKTNGRIVFKDLRLLHDIATRDELIKASKELGLWWDVEKKKKRDGVTRRGGSLVDDNRSKSVLDRREGGGPYPSSPSSSTCSVRGGSNINKRCDIQSEARAAAPTLRITLNGDGSRFGRSKRRQARGGGGGGGTGRTSTTTVTSSLNSIDNRGSRNTGGGSNAAHHKGGRVTEGKKVSGTPSSAATSSFSSREFANAFGGGDDDDDDDDDYAMNDFTATERATANTTVFRKWGDDLLPQITHEDGSTSAKIVYPSCCPEMPPDLKAR